MNGRENNYVLQMIPDRSWSTHLSPRDPVLINSWKKLHEENRQLVQRPVPNTDCLSSKRYKANYLPQFRYNHENMSSSLHFSHQQHSLKTFSDFPYMQPTWNAGVPPMHLTSRKKVIERKYFRFLSSTSLKASEVCLNPLEASGAQNWSVYHLHFHQLPGFLIDHLILAENYKSKTQGIQSVFADASAMPRFRSAMIQLTSRITASEVNKILFCLSSQSLQPSPTTRSRVEILNDVEISKKIPNTYYNPYLPRCMFHSHTPRDLLQTKPYKNIGREHRNKK